MAYEYKVKKTFTLPPYENWPKKIAEDARIDTPYKHIYNLNGGKSLTVKVKLQNITETVMVTSRTMPFTSCWNEDMTLTSSVSGTLTFLLKSMSIKQKGNFSEDEKKMIEHLEKIFSQYISITLESSYQLDDVEEITRQKGVKIDKSSITAWVKV